jgi:hypothetical protein
MKQIYLIVITALTLSSCSHNKKPEGDLGFCENELKLLCYDTLAPITNYDLTDIRKNVWTKFDSIFEDFYCRQVKLKVNFKIDSINTIKILLYSNNRKNCDLNLPPPPPFNPYVHWIHIYLDKNDTLFIRRQFSTLYSVKNAVIMRYHELPKEKYFRVNIALLWDLETDTEKFSKLIKDCIEGYLFVADELSMDLFQKPVCNLAMEELQIIHEKIPFKLRTDFGESVPDNYDFVPQELPPF